MNAVHDQPFAQRQLAVVTRRRLLAAAAGIATIGLSGCRGTAIEHVPAAAIAPFPGLGDPPLLVDVPWLLTRRADPNSGRTLVLDLSDLPTYHSGHIPGAVHAWWQDWIDPFSDIYGVLLGTRNVPSARTDLLAKLGIDNETTVIAYDADQNRYAAHLVWILRYVGLAFASVLDGGLGAWLGAGEDGSDQAESAPDADLATLSIQTPWTIPINELADRYQDPAVVIVDVRTDAEAADDLNGLLEIGQIPRSIRIPWTSTVRDDAGRLQSPDNLKNLFRAAGVMPDREVIIVARFGVETGQTWLVLSLLGYPMIRVFDRGWAQWGRKDEDRPIEPLTPLS